MGSVHSRKHKRLQRKASMVTGSSIFDYEVQDMNGARVDLKRYRGKKAYLLVNVASK